MFEKITIIKVAIPIIEDVLIKYKRHSIFILQGSFQYFTQTISINILNWFLIFTDVTIRMNNILCISYTFFLIYMKTCK